MGNGWIKLHRKLIENPIFQNERYLKLWVYLLLKANHKSDKIMWNGGVLDITEGQFVTGRKQIALDTGLKESTIEDILIYLEKQHQIRQQKTSKFRVITILKWDEYQHSDIKSDNKATTKRQQSDTNKNDNKGKNEKKDTAQSADSLISLKEEIEKLYLNERRDLNIIGWYFEKRKPDIRTKGQLQSAIRRHLRAAKQLCPFNDDQIGKAHRFVEAEYPEWTIETLTKKLSK